MITNIDDSGYQLILELEGKKNMPYQDSIGIWTCGIGFTSVNGKKVTQNMYLSDEEIKKQFFMQAKFYEKRINQLITNQINQNQYDAIFCFCYNLGIGTLSKSSMLKIINKDPNDQNIRTKWRQYVNAGGKKIPGLVTRREKEIETYFK